MERPLHQRPRCALRGLRDPAHDSAGDVRGAGAQGPMKLAAARLPGQILRPMPARLVVSALIVAALAVLPAESVRAQTNGDGSDGGLVGLVLPVRARVIGQGGP